MSYNGWKNYESWAVVLWIDKDSFSYSTRQEMAQNTWDETDGGDDLETRLSDAKRALSESLKDWVEEMNPLANDNSLFSDLLSAALSEVDWWEIAENFLEDIEKPEPEEPEEEEIEEEEQQRTIDPLKERES